MKYWFYKVILYFVKKCFLWRNKYVNFVSKLYFIFFYEFEVYGIKRNLGIQHKAKRIIHLKNENINVIWCRINIQIFNYTTMYFYSVLFALEIQVNVKIV